MEKSKKIVSIMLRGWRGCDRQKQKTTTKTTKKNQHNAQGGCSGITDRKMRKGKEDTGRGERESPHERTVSEGDTAASSSRL